MRKEYLPINIKIKPLSRGLRKNMTKQEKHLWYDFLKQHPQQFNRQRIIGNYIMDFYCDKVKLVIELDGSQHFAPDMIEYDQRRTDFLEDLGLKVLHFSNIEIDRGFEGVCMIIEQTILNRRYL